MAALMTRPASGVPVATGIPVPQDSDQKKTKLCTNFAAGHCRFGVNCNFAHGEGELRGKTVKGKAVEDPTNALSLGQILRFVCESAKPADHDKSAAAWSVETNKDIFDFRHGENGANKVQKRGTQRWTPVEGATSVFSSPLGLVFYCEDELHEARIQVAADEETTGLTLAKATCKYKNMCTNPSCNESHPFGCRFGVGCRDPSKCKFLHPDPSTVTAGAQVCQFGVMCNRKTCEDAHPLGRMGPATFKVKPIFATHNADLTPLATGPEELNLGKPPAKVTHFSFQGEFVFYYTPYDGPWAKTGHFFQTVTILRFNANKQAHIKVGDYSLDGHYCNAAVGSGGYFVLSWWPYEDEAIRAIWEAGKQTREKDRMIRALQLELASKDIAIQRRDEKLNEVQQQLQRERKQREWLEQKERARREEAERKKQEWLERRQLREAAREQAIRAARERAERNHADRIERFRLKDPIHIYALAGGAAGNSAKDWTLILDYHKGAHSLELSPPSSAKAAGIGVSERPLQRLRITEHSKVFEFELCAPTDLRTVGRLPIVLGLLCEGF